MSCTFWPRCFRQGKTSMFLCCDVRQWCETKFEYKDASTYPHICIHHHITFGNVAPQEASHPPKRATRVCTRSSSSPAKLHLNWKFIVQINILLPKLSSRKAEPTIQKAIQDFDSGVEPSIRKASNVRSLPWSTVIHCHAGRLPWHLAYKTILHPYQED